MRQLVEDAGLTLTDQDFDAAWALAVEADGGGAAAAAAAATGGATAALAGGDRACVDTFFRARHHLLAQTLQIAPSF